MTPPIRYGETVVLSPRVRRITQNNPGLFAGPGTNTHLVGDSTLWILDPGEDLGDGHLERIVRAVGGASVQAVIPSHGHPDHWPLAAKLAEAVGAPIWFHGPHPEFPVARSLGDGEVLVAGQTRLTVIDTPGHTRDHLSFWLAGENALFPGDVVMGWSSSIIAPPEGDLHQYLASLDRLTRVPNLQVLYPAHGEAILDPYRRIAELRHHREMRTQQIVEALGAGPATIAELVATIYRDVSPTLHPAAGESVRAHLLALEAEQKVKHDRRPEDLGSAASMWRLAEPQR